MNIEIRPARHDDIGWLVPQLQDFSVFFGSKKSIFPKDSEYLNTGLKMLMDKHFFRIAEIDSLPVGFCAGFINTHLFNPEIKTLTELFWWTDPQHRNNGVGRKLMEHFVSFGREISDWITFSLRHNTQVNPEFLTSYGFKPVENCYIMEVN